MKNETNKLSCAVVRDLLPLYHDGVVSNETNAAVEEHINSCENCSAELESFGAKLPEIKESSGLRFMNMMKRQKTRRILKYTLCFAAGAVAVYALIRFLCSYPIVKLDPELINAERVYRYEFDDCELEYCKSGFNYIEGNDKTDDHDNGFFIYLTMPARTSASVRAMRISRDNGNVELSFYKPIINTSQNLFDEGKTFGDIYTVPFQEGDRSLSINGKVIWEGDSPDEELPPYVEAYHMFEYGSSDTTWATDDSGEVFSFYHNGTVTEWDLDGNVLKKDNYKDDELSEQ